MVNYGIDVRGCLIVVIFGVVYVVECMLVLFVRFCYWLWCVAVTQLLVGLWLVTFRYWWFGCWFGFVLVSCVSACYCGCLVFTACWVRVFVLLGLLFGGSGFVCVSVLLCGDCFVDCLRSASVWFGAVDGTLDICSGGLLICLFVFVICSLMLFVLC